MPKITVRCSEAEKDLWVEGAWEARMRFSEWVRQVLNEASPGDLAAGDTGDYSASRQRERGASGDTPGSPAPAARSFRPDPKGGRK